MKLFKKDKKRLKMAILMVNGKFNYKDRLWLELSIGNILRFTSPHTNFKIFLWNHDYESPKVSKYLESVSQYVEVISEKNFDLSRWNGFRHESPSTKKIYFAGGFHVIQNQDVRICYRRGLLEAAERHPQYLVKPLNQL